jgi:putative ABC transport system permease protein
MHTMKFEMRMVWRETRPALRRFLFLVAVIALGVGALTGLRGFTYGLRRSIFGSARDLIASDLAVRMNSVPSRQEIAVLESLARRGAALTRTTETLSMVSSAKSASPTLCDIRAVDPSAYPFYGKVELTPPVPLREALADDSAVASQDFFIKTATAPGETVQIGSGQFRLTAVLKSEPDRIGVGIDLGPRILITRVGLERSGLIQFGSRASESFLYRLPADGLSLDDARNIINSGIKRRIRVTDYRNPNPSITEALERTSNFLSLVGLLSILVGGLGVSTTIHTYLQQKLDTIAVLKCIGGRSRQIIRIYLFQGLALGIAGSMVGIGLGYALQLFIPRLLRNLVYIPSNVELAPGAVIQGFTIGVWITLLFLLAPLLAVRKVKPASVFLRDMPKSQYSSLGRLRRDPAPLICSVLLVLGTGLTAGWLAHSIRWGFVFLLCLLGAVAVLSLCSMTLLRLVKLVPRVPSMAFQQGLRNIYRPGNHVTSVLMALGLGVAFILTIYFIQTCLVSQIVKSAPSGFPNIFLLGVNGTDKPALSAFLEGQREIKAHALVPAISSHLTSVDGRTADEQVLTSRSRRYFQMEFTLSWSETVPPDTRIIEGTWWHPPYASPMISVGENAAQNLSIHLGSVLEFDVAGKTVRGRVVNIRDVEFSRPGTSNQFIFSPGALDGLPTSYIGTVRIDPARTAQFQAALFRQFPNITSIDVGQVLTRVQDLLDKISGVIRFIALFSMAAGVMVLAASIASTRYQRMREVALLKTLGATRSQVAGIQAAEFLIVGLAAGLIGSILASVAAHYLLGKLLKSQFEFQWLPFLTATAGTALLAIATGWVVNRGVLNHKPLEILRQN